jgi:DMSO reductase family type II enzyme heme b subunit
VNIWYWNAGSDEAQNLAAGGFGSTTRFDTKSLKASAQHNADQGGQWTVVFSRPLASEGDHEADMTALDGVQLAFAVWQGANGERDGLKRTSTDWMTLSTGASN